MSVKKFRFVSPGVFVNEIDNSQIPATPAGIGPVVIGRALKGPALRPVTVNSFEEFVNTFGTPAPGGAGDDVWREGTDKSATTYGMYAAQAYLKNSSPLTYIRLLAPRPLLTVAHLALPAKPAGVQTRLMVLSFVTVAQLTFASTTRISSAPSLLSFMPMLVQHLPLAEL